MTSPVSKEKRSHQVVGAVRDMKTCISSRVVFYWCVQEQQEVSIVLIRLKTHTYSMIDDSDNYQTVSNRQVKECVFRSGCVHLLHRLLHHLQLQGNHLLRENRCGAWTVLVLLFPVGETVGL